MHAVAFSSSAYVPRAQTVHPMCTPSTGDFVRFNPVGVAVGALPPRRPTRPICSSDGPPPARARARARSGVVGRAGGHAKHASASLGMPSNLPKKPGGRPCACSEPSSALKEPTGQRAHAVAPSARWRSYRRRRRARPPRGGGVRGVMLPAGTAAHRPASPSTSCRRRRRAPGHARVRRDEPRRARRRFGASGYTYPAGLRASSPRLLFRGRKRRRPARWRIVRWRRRRWFPGRT